MSKTTDQLLREPEEKLQSTVQTPLSPEAQLDDQSQTPSPRLTHLTAPSTLAPFVAGRLSGIRRLTNKLTKRVPQFNTLPAEIRLMIWEFAMPEGRVHELHPCTTLMENNKMMFRSNHSKPPTILSVCRESRAIALQNYELMSYEAPTGTKGIRKFYFSPRNDTLFLNTLMGLYMAFMLLETEVELDSPLGQGVMKGWQNVALDADRAHLLDLLAGHHGHPASPRLREVFPDLQNFTIALDFTRKGRTRFRTSVWPGEAGTTLRLLNSDGELLTRLSLPIIQFTRMQYGKRNKAEVEDANVEDEEDEAGLPKVHVAAVKRKRFIRGDLRYAFRKSCSFLHVRPPAIFMRL